MERRDFLKLGAAWSLAALLSGRQNLLAESKKQKMNILWIVADDMGCGDLGCYGATDISTPHLDHLAAEGILFERAYVSPVCSPTRTSLLTGRYPQDFRMEQALTGDDHGTLTPDPVTAAECFQADGYRTALIGKWHLGKEPSAHPQNQGFESFYGLLGGVINYYKHTYLSPGETDENKAKVDYFDGKALVSNDVYSTDDLTDKALSYLKKREEDQSPFFLQLAYNAPHYARGVKKNQNLPAREILQAPEEYIEKFAKNPQAPSLREMYCAVVSNMDDNIGRILDMLDQTGLRENTLVLFMSDNGATLAHGGSNGTLRGQKHTVWEGGIRAPLILRMPAPLPAAGNKMVSGIRFRSPYFVRDIFPTCVELAGIPSFPKENGVSYGHSRASEWLVGKEVPTKRPEFFKFGEERAVVCGRWKWIQENFDSPPQLFDLEKDMSEQEDISSQHPNIVAEMESAWNCWYASYAERELEIAIAEEKINSERLEKAQGDERKKAQGGYEWSQRELLRAQHWMAIVGKK